jgi:hypothetical protein
MHFRCMSATLDLPIQLNRLTPEEITWLAAKSNQTGKPVNEVAKDLISAATEKAGFGQPQTNQPRP